MDEQATHTGYILPPSQGPRPVKALNAHVARKIAAGEVIDRPNAVLREFLDNAIDAGSTRIVAEITNGGIASIRVVDNGWGMTKADLEACARPHVTGKISDENDLENLFTLGFRGEALASIAAVSRLEITSCRNNEAWKMEAVIEGEHSVTPAVLHEGSIIVSQGLFENFPARRKFLKRAQSESSLCKQTF
ncbi:MAG: DNA mismatch repair endonuclease MutL, partial [Spirochaetales bacterium]